MRVSSSYRLEYSVSVRPRAYRAALIASALMRIAAPICFVLGIVFSPWVFFGFGLAAILDALFSRVMRASAYTLRYSMASGAFAVEKILLDGETIALARAHCADAAISVVDAVDKDAKYLVVEPDPFLPGKALKFSCASGEFVVNPDKYMYSLILLGSRSARADSEPKPGGADA